MRCAVIFVLACVTTNNCFAETITAKDVTPKTVVFAENRPIPFNSDWVDVRGYDYMTINLSVTDWIWEYGVHYSEDQEHFIVQDRFRFEGGVANPPDVTIPILGSYYRISTGYSQGNVTAYGTLTSVPEPSTIALMASGLFAIACWVFSGKRRLG